MSGWVRSMSWDGTGRRLAEISSSVDDDKSDEINACDGSTGLEGVSVVVSGVSRLPAESNEAVVWRRGHKAEISQGVDFCARLRQRLGKGKGKNGSREKNRPSQSTVKRITTRKERPKYSSASRHIGQG
jgi:hypothetical protein